MSPRRVGAGAALVALLAALSALPGCRQRGAPAQLASAATSADLYDPLAPRRPITPAERALYAGNEACAPCHPQEARRHAESHHAHSAAPVDPALHGEAFRKGPELDDTEGTRYRPRMVAGECVLEATRGGETVRVRAEHALGSGARGVTFLGRYQEKPTELRLSYYGDRREWDFTPGQEVGVRHRDPTVAGRRLDTALRCFICHSSALVAEKGQARPEQSILGVGCETCHGPGPAHIAAVERGDRPLARAPDRRMVRLADHRDRVSRDLCAGCHRSLDSLDDVHASDPGQIPRLQWIALSMSACATPENTPLACTTCHDPHADAARISRADYNGRCTACHTPATPAQLACKVRPRGDCVSCHMPVQKVSMPGGPRFHTHFIRAWRNAK